MSRLMSVAMTTDAVIRREKTVTRRKGWWLDKNGRRLLNVGDTLTLCRKVQGRKPGESIERLAEVEVIDIRREPLCAVAGPYVFDKEGVLIWPEVIAEGFPDMHPNEFMRRFFIEPQGIEVMDDVTRIEFRYLDACELCAEHVRCDRCEDRVCWDFGPEPRACGTTCCDCPCDCTGCRDARDDATAETLRHIERECA